MGAKLILVEIVPFPTVLGVTTVDNSCFRRRSVVSDVRTNSKIRSQSSRGRVSQRDSGSSRNILLGLSQV